MIKTIPLRSLFVLPRVVDLFTPLLFLYFVTLHADRLNFQLGGSVRFNNLLAMALLIILTLRLRKEFFRIEKWIALWLGVLVASILLSMLLSPHFKRCFLHMIWFVWTILSYLWLPYQCMAKLDPKKVLQLYLSSFLVVGIYAICQLFTGPLGDPFVTQWIPPGMGRPNAMNYEPSYYVLYMCPFVILQTVLYLGKEGSVSGKRLFLIYVLYLCSASASALFSFFVFFIMVLFFQRYRLPALKLAFKLSLAMVPVFLIGGSLALNYFLKNMAFREHNSVDERWSGMEDCLKLFKQRPFVGFGLGGVPPERVKQKLYYIRQQQIGSCTLKEAECNNLGSEILASLGLIGAAAFALMIGLYGRHYFLKRRGTWDDGFFIATMVMIVTWQINQTLMRPYCWTFFAIALAYLQTKQPSLQSPKEAVGVESLDRVS